MSQSVLASGPPEAYEPRDARDVLPDMRARQAAQRAELGAVVGRTADAARTFVPDLPELLLPTGTGRRVGAKCWDGCVTCLGYGADCCEITVRLTRAGAIIVGAAILWNGTSLFFGVLRRWLGLAG